MADRGDRYFSQREAEMRARGIDPDDDEEWARPDNETAESALDEQWR